jgi:hypothetical protein
MATHEQDFWEVLNAFNARKRGDITDDQFAKTLKQLRARGVLNEEVVITLDNSLAQGDEKAPQSATTYRMMSLAAARVVGVPALIGNAAFSASKVAWLIDKNVTLAISWSVESIEAYAQVEGIPPESLARSFRNLARLFPVATASDLKGIETAFPRLLAVAESLKGKGFDLASVAACIDPLIDSYSHLTSIGLSHSYFSRLRQLAT